LDGCDIRHLDFACGTGRILGHLENRTSTSVGVDLSPSMLDVGRQYLKHSQLIEADLTRGDVLGHRTFNLITAFRFFPNAQAELRSEAIQVLAKHLAKDGCLVFNNHRNLSSLTHRLARICGRGGREGMAMAEVDDLVRKHGMRIARTYHLCVFPVSERKQLLPQFMLRPIECACSCCPLFRSLSQNLIFACKRDEN
jgi:predicted TPR repeat methyltransferase